MAVQLGFVFSELDNIKNKLKVAKNDLKEIMDNDDEFESLNEKKKKIALNLSAVKSKIKADNSDLISLIDELSINLKSQKQLLSDKALTDIVSGKNIEIKHKGFIYQPEFSVKYVKTSKEDEDNEKFFSK